MNNSNEPKLRFPEFSDAWQQKMLGSIYQKVRNGFVGTATPHYVKKGHKYIQGKDIKNGSIQDTVKNFVSDEFYTSNKKAILQKNDIVMVQSGHVGECATVTESSVGASCHAVLIMTSEDSVASDFYIHFFYSDRGRKLIHKITTGNTVEHILASDIKKALVPSCSQDEQAKISSFLALVDKKIELNAQKIHSLKLYKKSLVQEIFTQQVRFKNTRGENFPNWEEKSLLEIADRVTDRNVGSKITTVLTNSAVQGIVNQSDFFEKDIANQGNLTNYHVVSTDDFVYNPRISAHAPVGPVKRNHLSVGVMSPLYSVFRFKQGVLDFFESYFETKYWHEYLKSVANSGARHDRMNITNADFYELTVPFPALKEQQAIANFLAALNNRIKVEEAKLAGAQKFKKALLQRMYI